MNETGMRAEELVAELFRRAGLRILARNWRCRHGEIDLIAQEGATLGFAAARYRRRASLGGRAGASPRGRSGGGASSGGAAESITDAKRSRLVAAAGLYLAGRPQADCR